MARSRPAILLALALAAAALLAMSTAPAAASKYNITKILEPYKEFSKFNAMLSETRLANDINRRQTITVLAVNNAAMSALDHYSKQTRRHILSLHVLVDYYGKKKLKKGGSTASSTLFMVRTCNSTYYLTLLHLFARHVVGGMMHLLTMCSLPTQATGVASETAGYVNITRKGGKINFKTEDADAAAKPAQFVKSIKEHPYDIAVLQVSSIISSAEA
jgi:uncharacterized surface protein with fasciclin (FAS1) repeats